MPTGIAFHPFRDGSGRVSRCRRSCLKAGAFYGASGIPAGWLEKLAERELIEQLADGLLGGEVAGRQGVARAAAGGSSATALRAVVLG